MSDSVLVDISEVPSVGVSKQSLFVRLFKRRIWVDRLGIFLSALCAVHCFLTPIALLALQSSLWIVNVNLLHERFHELLLFILPCLALIAFVPGYLGHRNAKVFFLALPGFLLILGSAFLFDHSQESLMNHVSIQSLFSTVISIAGSGFLIAAHFLNRRLSICCHTPGETCQNPLAH
jgi:hypothetical protein